MAKARRDDSQERRRRDTLSTLMGYEGMGAIRRLQLCSCVLSLFREIRGTNIIRKLVGRNSNAVFRPFLKLVCCICPCLEPGAMPNTKLLKDIATYSWLTHLMFQYVLPSVIRLVSWLSPNGDYRTTWRSVGDLFNASSNEKDYGKHSQVLYLGVSRETQAGAEATDEDRAECRLSRQY